MPNRFTTTQETLLPKGVKDFLPLKAAKIEYLNRTLQKVFHSWGFRPVCPPALENLDVLEYGLGTGLRERTFRFDDRQSGKLVAFPPDITPQIARIFATRMQDLPLPQRLCYSGRVLRHAEQQAGKDREIFQAGVELIGLESAEADAEMITMAIESIQAVGAEEFTIDIGQVEFFNGIMAAQFVGGAAELVRVVLGDQAAVGKVDFGVARLFGQPQHAIRVVARAAEPVGIEGVADQQPDQRAQQRVDPQQRRAGEEAQQFSIPASHAAEFTGRRIAGDDAAPGVHYAALPFPMDRVWQPPCLLPTSPA
jgi:ATP phosphoribosyltransferase regulatory subunit HisZ